MAANRKPGVSNAELLSDSHPQLVLVRQHPYRPDPVCRDDSLALVRYARQTAYAVEAWGEAQTFYVWPSILKHAGKDFLELIKGVLPGLLIAFGAVITTTGLGALIGGAVGGIGGGGVGAVPGAIYGGEIGFAIGTWLLEYFGLAILAFYMADALSKTGRQIGGGLKRAWNSCGSDAVIDAAAQDIAEGFGCFFDAMFQALVAYVAEEGMAAALKAFNKSKIIVGLGKFFKTDAFREATVSYWLEKIGKPGEPQLVRNRVAVVIEFVRDKAKGLGGQSFPSKKIGEVLSGTDFNTPVASPKDLVATFKTGDVLTQRPDATWGGGNWFSKSGYSAGSVGVAEGTRGYKIYEVLKPFEALKTRSAAIDDTFTQGRRLDVFAPTGETGADIALAKKAKAAEFIQGGGSQYFAEKHVNDLVSQGYLKEIYQNTKKP